MILQNPRRNELTNVPGLNNALDQLIARLNGVLAPQHATDGTHSEMTATSVTTPLLIATGRERLTAVISPAQITANRNDYTPTDAQSGAALIAARVVRVNSDASRNLTGLQAQPAGTVLTFHNIGTQSLVFVHDSSSSQAGNRFYCPGSTDFTLALGESVDLWYDALSVRWRVKGF